MRVGRSDHEPRVNSPDSPPVGDVGGKSGSEKSGAAGSMHLRDGIDQGGAKDDFLSGGNHAGQNQKSSAGAEKIDVGSLKALSFLDKLAGQLDELQKFQSAWKAFSRGGDNVGGAIGQTMDRVFGNLLGEAMEKLSGRSEAQSPFKSITGLVKSLTGGEDFGKALGEVKSFRDNLRGLSDLAKGFGFEDVAKRFESFAGKSGDIARLVDAFKDGGAGALDKLREQLGGIDSLQDAKELLTKLSADGLLGRTLEGAVGKDFAQIREAIEGLPEAKEALESFTRAARELGSSKGWKGAGWATSMSGDLKTLSDLVRKAGNEDLAKKLDGMSKTVDHVTGAVQKARTSGLDLEGVTPEKAWGAVKEYLPKDMTLAQGKAEWEATLYKTEGSFGSPDGPIYGRGSLTVGEVSASAEGRVSANLQELNLRAGGKVAAEVTVVHAEGEIHGRYGIAEGSARGEAYVGARAEAQGEVVFDPLKGNIGAQGEIDAYAGASAEVDGKIDIGGVGAEGGVQAYAGIGFEADIGASFDNGKLDLSFEFGAALGIGAGWDIQLSIDFAKLKDTISKYVPAARLAFEAAETAVDVAKGVVDVGKDVVEGVGNAAKKVGNFIKSLW